MKGSYAQFFASRSDVLRSKHSCVRRGLITISFNFHASGDAADGFAATGITQNVSLTCHVVSSPQKNIPEIGDMDKGIIERCENSGDAKNDLTY